MTPEQIEQLKRARTRLAIAARPIDVIEVPPYLVEHYVQFEQAAAGRVLLDNWEIVNIALCELLEAQNDRPGNAT